MTDYLSRYYRCPEHYVRFSGKERLPATTGYFQFGQATCYGEYGGCRPTPSPIDELHDALQEVVIKQGSVYLPFDPSQIVDNLRREVYVGDWRQGASSALARAYYFLRPVLSVGVRRHLQRFHLRGWEKLSFPRWPVDFSVDNVFEQLMLSSLRRRCRPNSFYLVLAGGQFELCHHDPRRRDQRRQRFLFNSDGYR